MDERSVKLRQWQDSDLEPFVAMNADPEVMRYFLHCLTHEETVAVMTRLQDAIERAGWGVWAVEVDGEFAGYTGLSVPKLVAPLTPCVEIMWRFQKRFWGQSIAYRAAIQAEEFAAQTLRLTELVSFTTNSNTRSRKLMERLGFSRNPAEDFAHPLVPSGHPLENHVLYRKKLDGPGR